MLSEYHQINTKAAWMQRNTKPSVLSLTMCICRTRWVLM